MPGTGSARTVEIDSLHDFDRRIRSATSLAGWFVSSLDLTDRSAQLERVDPTGAVFLGCRLVPATESSLRSRGALLFPGLPDLPFDPYRPRLYTAADLYGERGPVGAGQDSHAETAASGVPYADSADAAIYAWSRPAGAAPSVAHALACALHDHAIGDALDDATEGRDPALLVGVMGGHALLRGDPGYRAAAELGGRLTRNGRTVLTGGGPGAMEAANLGAYLSSWPDALAPALAILSTAAGYAGAIDDWLAAALTVQRRWSPAAAGQSLSVPTWFYGHEPTNVFATGIAKYFTNALREDTLLHRCRGGIVYLPGQAGTVQEIFQAVTDNFYAADAADISPLVLVGRHYWSVTYPVWPLLQQLAHGRRMAAAVHLVDTVEQAADLLLE